MLKQILEKELKERKLSSRGAADAIGVSHTTILRALRGDVVDLETVLLISDWLHVRPSTLLNSMNSTATLSDQIAAIVERNPRLNQVFSDATIAVKAGEADPAIIEDIIAYALFKLNLQGEGYAESTSRKVKHQGEMPIVQD
jgi:transcriptional regulator with XRE-family HTH domain